MKDFNWIKVIKDIRTIGQINLCEAKACMDYIRDNFIPKPILPVIDRKELMKLIYDWECNDDSLLADAIMQLIADRLEHPVDANETIEKQQSLCICKWVDAKRFKLDPECPIHQPEEKREVSQEEKESQEWMKSSIDEQKDCPHSFTPIASTSLKDWEICSKCGVQRMGKPKPKKIEPLPEDDSDIGWITIVEKIRELVEAHNRRLK